MSTLTVVVVSQYSGGWHISIILSANGHKNNIIYLSNITINSNTCRKIMGMFVKCHQLAQGVGSVSQVAGYTRPCRSEHMFATFQDDAAPVKVMYQTCTRDTVESEWS